MQSEIRNRPKTCQWAAQHLASAYSLSLLILSASAVLLDAGEWQTGPGYRYMALPVPASGKTGFTLLPSTTTGILFSNTIPESMHLTNQILLDGAGVAAGDIDGDGWCDLYFCSVAGSNKLYRNLGNWHFEDVTDQAGVACAGLHSTGAGFADIDGDGDLDLIVNTTGNGTHLFLNDGHGHFTAFPVVLNPGKGGKSLALADIDGDGYLDLYVVNYRTASVMDTPSARVTFKMVNGKQTVATFNGRPTTEPDLVDRFSIGPQGDFQENGEPDVLYRNLDGTNFVEVPFTRGNFLDEAGRPLTKPPLDWGLSAMFRDINGDGLPDLYVCNDFQSPDRFWINQGDGKFRLIPQIAQRKSSMSSMAVDFADINRDGFDDFMVVDMMSREHSERMRFLSVLSQQSVPSGQSGDRPQYELNTLFLSRGDTTFAEIAQLSGLEAAEWAWSCIFLDVDLDGWEDLLVINGIERTGRDLDVLDYFKQLRKTRNLSDAEVFQNRLRFPRQANGNLAFRNRGDLTFEETSKAWGFDWKGTSTAMALADLDNDGDLDVIVNPVNGPALIYRNDSSAPRLAVRLKGQAPNTRGIGARIAVLGGPVPLQTQEMICAGRYLSCDDTLRTFAAGTSTNQLSIQVAWRSGRFSTITNALPNHLYEVDEASAQPMPAGARPSPFGTTPETSQDQSGAFARPLFEDVSSKVGHIHSDAPFDDFARQPLLPNKLSQLGPGVAWCDIDGDGRDDLIIGSGGGGTIGVYLNRGTNGFVRWDEPAWGKPVTRDQTGLVAWRAANQALLLAGCANYEDGTTNGPCVRVYDFSGKTIGDALPAQESSTGPLALADLVGDGNLELFVAGRVLPGRYPETASSRIYRHKSQSWEIDVPNTRALEKIGLVSGAVFTDLDGDGFPELVLACEWGAIRIFHNEQGHFVPWNVPLTWPNDHSAKDLPTTINQLQGWWNGVTSGDFDGDGRLDLVVSNWGRNTKYESLRSRPLSIYYGDLAGDGSTQLVEAHYEPPLGKTVPLRQLTALAKGLPFVRGRFSSHKVYSTASIEEVLGNRLPEAKILHANCLESIVLLNRGDHFEARFLPVEGQIAPAFGICVGDFDGDGNEDIFLAQNFFACQPETPRYDAGRGLLLSGDGKGGFRAVPGQKSGIMIYGEQRGAAVCDFDGDGRLDLAVAQNRAETKLYRNAGAKPGLRVKLVGTGDNEQGVGAVMRVKLGDHWGPAREVHAGSGYWSQDSTTQVLATPQPASEIQVRWPGGKTTANSIPPQAQGIVVGTDGKISTLP